MLITTVIQMSSIYLDFKKAFDSVPHQKLLYTIWRIGTTRPLWLQFHNYLSSRYRFVSFDGASSECLPVLSGVHQGSVLGPLLFLICINDLPQAIPHSSIYFCRRLQTC